MHLGHLSRTQGGRSAIVTQTSRLWVELKVAKSGHARHNGSHGQAFIGLCGLQIPEFTFYLEDKAELICFLCSVCLKAALKARIYTKNGSSHL